MSNAKFASVTAQLLARKGEAMPWVERGGQNSSWKSSVSPFLEPSVRPKEAPAKIAQPPVSNEAAPLGKREKAGNPDVRRISVRMSKHDYERLGIVAVKRGTSRQLLMQEALDLFLSGEAKRLACSCLNGACGAGCTG